LAEKQPAKKKIKKKTETKTVRIWCGLRWATPSCARRWFALAQPKAKGEQVLP